MSTIVIDARKIKSSTGRYAFELVTNLEAIDHTNHYKIVVLPGDVGYYKPTNPNFEVVVADYAHYSFGEQLGFARFLRRLKPDLVHFYMPQQPLMFTRPAVTTVHDLNLLNITNNDMGRAELAIKKRIFAFLLRRVAHRSAYIITPTQYTKDGLVQWAHIPPKKVTVTYEGVYKLTKVQAVPGEFDHVPFIVFLGRGEPYKNNRGLIEAHQLLLKQHPDLRLAIIGAIDDLRQADIDWVKEKGYKHVHFLGFLPDEQAAWLYRRAKAFVLPSFMEGFGLPALEAMAQGTPIVSTNTTCSPEVYGDAAHYFDPHNAADMARAINDVLKNPKLRAKLLQNGKQQVAQYSWRRMAEQTLHIYQQVLKKQKIPR